MKGQHDDCIMAMAMCLYVARTSFASLEKVNNQTKAMLESWVNTAANGEHTTKGRQMTPILRNQIMITILKKVLNIIKVRLPQHIVRYYVAMGCET